MLNILSYNPNQVRENGSIDHIKEGYNVWVDLVNPTEQELLRMYEVFHLDDAALGEYLNLSKKPQIRVADSQKFVLGLDIKFQDAKTLVTEGVFFFVGGAWLLTIHSDKVDLQSKVKSLFQQKKKAITGSSIDGLFYSILANIVDSYEQLLTSIELTVSNFEQRTLYKPSKIMLEYLDYLSRQIIILRRHFWHMRDIINYLTHTEEEKDDVKYLKIVYDDINQLIEMVESYRDSINSTRELYIASVSLQMSDTMKTLTIFSAVLLPLTFITSMYGMNGVDLQNLVNLPIGFAVVATTMGVVTFGLFIYFKKKQWIFTGRDDSIMDKIGKEHESDSEQSRKHSIKSFATARNKNDKSHQGEEVGNDQNYSSLADKIAKRTADSIRDSNTE